MIRSDAGSVVTFFSYKGGTGRTMALANTACVLAERAAPGEHILVVDWDLEAPGLHQYLPPRLRPRTQSLDIGLGDGPGLIDLFIALRDALPDAAPKSEDDAEAAAQAALAAVRLEHYVGDTEFDNVHIVRAGRNDDGGYAKRVGTFDWEGLFVRAPTIYRRVAEAWAGRYRHVLIDSRTGVSDISGICTSLLPEKLVVVFTPNRQSFTGVRELVRRATAYRLGSDDLRPLLVYPLPSRIEVSMEKLNAFWRHGSVDAGIAGYQPMFEQLLKECYALKACDLTAYFNDVQIQQSADCAYGEVISVRQTSGERLSLASSYRVFADRLLDESPPWQPPGSAPALPLPLPLPLPKGAAGRDESTVIRPAGPPPAEPQPVPAAFDQRHPERDEPITVIQAARTAPAEQFGGRRVFLSYAREDRAAAGRVATRLEREGYRVWFDRDLQAGVDFQQAVAEALDASSAVIVFWSRSSIASEWVRVEAGEASRRGVIVPVLLDDSSPPLEFRHFQSLDLSRGERADLAPLLAAVERVMRGNPASVAAAAAAPQRSVAGPPRRGFGWWLRMLAGAYVALSLLGGLLWLVGRPDRPSLPAPTNAASNPAPVPALLAVPDLVGRSTQDVRKVAEVVGLQLAMVDRKSGAGQAYLEGVVVAQQPAAGAKVAVQSTVRLTVETQTAHVPSVVGVPLGAALAILEKSGLALGNSQQVQSTGAPAGRVVRQSPEAGALVAAGTKVDVGVAAGPVP